MNIPELSKSHKLAIFCLVALIIIIMIMCSTPLDDDFATSGKAKTVTTEKPKKKKPVKKKAEKPAPEPPKKPEPVAVIKPQRFVNKDPEMVSLQALFAPYKHGKATTEQEAKAIPLQQFAKLVETDIGSFSDTDFKIIETALLNADNLNIGTLGLAFVSSDKEKLKFLGLELMTQACIKKTEYFQPNKFYMAFAEKGFAAEPFITEIIESTRDDFCREWACELYVDIFFHNTDDSDSRHQKLAGFKQKEENLLQRILALLAKEEQMKKIIASKQSLGDQIRLAWGRENRYSLKLLEVTKLLDNLNAKNQYPTTQKVKKVIRKYNFNYDILNHINGKPVELPPIPPEVELKYLAHAVFGDKVANTFQWLHKKDGGFTKQDVKIALENKDQKQIKHMIKVLRHIICAVLRGKLLLGMGNHELEILRYFYFSNWEKRPVKWSDNQIFIRNMKGKGAPLILATKADTEKILTGKGVTSSNVEDRQVEFFVPPQSVFIWFVQNGEYILSVNKKNTVYKPEDLIHFDDKKIRVDNHNITLDIY